MKSRQLCATETACTANTTRYTSTTMGAATWRSPCKTAQPAAETMIFIKPERISIGERYRIVDENFNERLDRTGVGSTDKKTPDATVHVLIMVDGLFDCIPSLQLNANEKRRFFMEWNDRCEKNGVENAVCVASEYSFTFQQMMKNRPALLNRKLRAGRRILGRWRNFCQHRTRE